MDFTVEKENQVQCKMLKGDWAASKEDLGAEHQDLNTESTYHHVVAEKPIFWPRKDHVMEPVGNGPTTAATEVKSEVPAGKHDSLADLKVNFYCDCCNQQFYKRADFDNHKSASGHNKCVNQSKLSESCFKTEVKTRKELRELEKEKSKFLNSSGSLISSANRFAKITVKEERESTLPQNINDDGEQTSGQLIEDISCKEQELSKQNESQRGKEVARKRLKAFSQFRSTSPKAQEDVTSQKSSQITFTLTKKSRLSSYDQHPPTKESKIKSVVVKPLNTVSEQKKHIIHKPKEEHLECDNNINILGVEETLNSEVLPEKSKVKTKEEVFKNDIKVSIGNIPQGNLTIGASQCQTIAQESETSGNEQKDGSNENKQGSQGGNNKKEETNGKATDNNASGAANSSNCSGDNTATNGGSGDGDDNEDKDKKITSGGGSIDGKNGNAEEDGDGNDKKVNEEVNDTVGKEWKPCPKDKLLRVLNKDESTILQWPLDMVSYTKVEPSICYSCNPLHFEFRKPVITKENENIDGEVENKIEDVNLGNPNQPKNPVTLLLPRQVITKQAAQNKENNVSNPDALAAETSVEKKAKKSKKKKKKSSGKKVIDGIDGEKTNSSKHKSKKKGSRKRKRNKSKESKSGDKESGKHSHHSGDNYSDYSDDDHYSKRRRSKSSSKDKSRKRHHSFSSEDRSSDEEYRVKKSRRSGSRKDDDYENGSHRSRSSRDRSRRYSSDSDSDRSRSRSRRSHRRSRSRSYSRSYSRSRSRSRSRSHSRSPRSSRGSSDRSGKSGSKELREALKEQARANAAGKTVPLKEKKGGITAAGIQQQIAAGGHTIPTTTTIISDMDTKKESGSGQKQTNASNKGEVKNKVDSNSLNSDLHENYPENSDDKNYEDPEGLSEEEIQRRKEFFKKPGAPAPKAKRPVAYPHSVAAALYNIQNPEEISHELHEGASTSSPPVSSEDQSVINAEEESASTIKEMIPPEDIEKYRRLQEQARLHVQQKMIASGEIPPPPPPEAQATIERDVMSPSQQSVLLQNHPHLIGISRDGEVLHQAIGSPLLSQTGFAQAHLVQHHSLHRHATSPGPHTPSPPPSQHMLPAGVVPASFASLRTNLHHGTLPIGGIPVGAIPTGALHAGFPAGAIPAGALPAGAIPAGAIPTSAIQPGGIPAGAIPVGAFSGGAFSGGAFSGGAFPAGAIPAGAIPAGAIRVGGLPAGAIPAGSIPAGSVQSGSLPPGAIPLGIIPQGALPGGAVHASAIQRPGVPRFALPPGAVVVGGMAPGMPVPMEAVAAPRILQTGAFPRGAIPASALPKGVVKAGSLPRGLISVASLPRGAIPSESLPHGIISSSALQHGLIPARTIQAGGVRPGSIPSKVGALPQGLVPAGAIPRGLIQAGGMPVGSLPHGAFPLEALQRQVTPGRPIPGAVQVPIGSQVRMIMPGRHGLVPAAQGRYPGAYPQLAFRSGVLQQHPSIIQHNPGGIVHPGGLQPHPGGFQPHPGMTQPQRFPMPQQSEGHVRLPNLVGKPLIKTAPPKSDGDRT
ncbi:uncharacterized protein LOC117108003 isoform X2 [Anneissia japonica]|uniref:uncharacterized protein LOC117108003 isoform X2 n=1 Tax=Anneissia japonica TaxID=1529436 RepID=UPI001425BA2D|nr:uncharacterized protein LOC117108003 isoform X2 [Anneissia japonica]